MTVLQAIILGVVQGLTEFFPVSSSGHLVLGQLFFDIHEDVLLFDICVHLGTLFAVLLVFRNSVARLTGALFGGLGSLLTGKNSPAGLYRESPDIRTILAILIGTIPAVVVGFTMKDTLEALFHSSLAVFLALAFTGCVLLITFMVKDKRRGIGIISGFLIGIAQALAITPGVSRSGMTISAAMFLGIKREEAGEFSFLLSVPAILGATLLTVKDYLEVGEMSISLMALGAGFCAAFLSGWVSLMFLMGLVRKGRLGYFGFYCLAVAIIGLVLR